MQIPKRQRHFKLCKFQHAFGAGRYIHNGSRLAEPYATELRAQWFAGSFDTSGEFSSLTVLVKRPLSDISSSGYF